jgi:hypothetical protein
MIFKTPKGRKMLVLKTRLFTFGFAGHFNIFFISIRPKSFNDDLIKHELVHADQFFDSPIKFFKMVFDMDYMMEKEIEAYLIDGRYNTTHMARILSDEYSVFKIGKLFGWRTERYTYFECIKKINKLRPQIFK